MLPFQGQPVTEEEAREFCRQVLRMFPKITDHREAFQ